MDNDSGTISSFLLKTQEQNKEMMDELVAIAKPESVFSQPVVAGDRTVITASEVTVTMGFSGGMGIGKKSKEGAPQGEAPASGGGGGGGGGGVTMARPVVAIFIGPGEVEVKPVVDATKIAVAAITAAGAMFMVIGRMLRKRR